MRGRFSALGEWIAIARPRHYGKHILILAGVALAEWLHPVAVTGSLLARVLLGFVAACLIASSNYVLNEILDAATDRHHPRKRQRPLVEGRIQSAEAYRLWGVLGLLGLVVAAGLGFPFLAVAAVFLGMALLYNVPPVRLKDVAYVDILTEAVNSPLRLLLGWMLIAPQHLPSLSVLAAAWMAGCFAMTWKRFRELQDFEDLASAAAYRRSFANYSRGVLSAVIAAEVLAAMLLGVVAIAEIVAGIPA